MKDILLVEDNRHILDGNRYFLEKAGYTCAAAETIAGAKEIIGEETPRLMILDLMLPDGNGLDLLSELRASSDPALSGMPVLILTGLGSNPDVVRGLSAGGDDYLPKPFEPDELICRVRAMLRRGGGYTPDILTFGDVSLDTSSGMMTGSGGSVRLSGREFQLMEMFMRSPGVVFSADRIMEKIWGWDSDAEINVVWVHMSNLRKKLRSIGSDVTVHASRGLGYMLEKQ